MIWQALDIASNAHGELVKLDDDTELKLIYNLTDEPAAETLQPEAAPHVDTTSLDKDLTETFPLLRPIQPDIDAVVHRFSVTQLINYQRCARQYYFDRVLHVPSVDQMAVWNDAEAPEPPANLTATLKGAVIHKFCETYSRNDDAEQLLRKSFADVVRSRQSELADRLVEINVEHAISDLMPLAQNYLSSGVFERVERARAISSGPVAGAGGPFTPTGDKPGLWSELSFRLRCPHGILTGAIDKLLVTPSADGKSVDIEIVDFKTNRIRASKPVQEKTVAQTDVRFAPLAVDHPSKQNKKRHSQ